MTAATRLRSLATSLLGDDLPLRIRAWDGSAAGPHDAPVLDVRSRAALRRLAWQPDELGVAQAYITGEIDVPGGVDELRRGLRLLWRHARSAHLGRVRLTPRQRVRAALLVVRLGAFGRRPHAPASQAHLDGELHSEHRDREAISHHYDLSNEFYELLLDDSMAYSCAYFASDGRSVAEAQIAKLDLVCAKLGLRPGARMLDVGCGWGSLALRAAERFGARVLAVTLSARQCEYAQQQVAERDLAGLVEVRLQDYRTLDEPPFDAVASVEMGEHVGEDNYPAYLETLFGQLKPGRDLLLQQMSRRADAAPGGGPFIERYIAPDMHMRPLPATLALMEDAGFEIRHVEALREHYVRTVRLWLETLESNRAAAVALVGAERFRVWRLYLVGGGLAFEDGRMGVHQVVARRPCV